ncbi:MAG: Hsp70 family protein, partial [Candidatus Neomarinimicrobiota bacterium]
KATGKEQSIRIEASSGLSEQEVEKMVKDAKSNEAEDKTKREEIDLHNQAEQLIYQTEKNVKEFDKKLEKNDKKSIEDAVDELKKVNDGSTLDDIRSSMDKLNSIWNTLASKMYDASKAEKTAQSGSTGSGKESSKKKDDDEIEDADFEVVD